MDKKLLLREWVAVSLIVGMIGLLAALTWSSQAGKEKIVIVEKEKKQASRIELKVSGAVKAPGVYYFPPGTTVKEVLKEIPLDSKADRKRIDVKKVLYSSQSLLIPFKKGKEESGGNREKS